MKSQFPYPESQESVCCSTTLVCHRQPCCCIYSRHLDVQSKCTRKLSKQSMLKELCRVFCLRRCPNLALQVSLLKKHAAYPSWCRAWAKYPWWTVPCIVCLHGPFSHVCGPLADIFCMELHMSDSVPSPIDTFLWIQLLSNQADCTVFQSGMRSLVWLVQLFPCCIMQSLSCHLEYNVHVCNWVTSISSIGWCLNIIGVMMLAIRNV